MVGLRPMTCVILGTGGDEAIHGILVASWTRGPS
jgi:hypothetical protein